MSQAREEMLRELGYSDKAIRLIQEQPNSGHPSRSDVTAAHVGTCGDMLRLYLDLRESKILHASFEMTGCAGLQACAAALTTMIRGMTLDEADHLDVQALLAYLDKIPSSKMDCAQLACDALHKAVAKARALER